MPEGTEPQAGSPNEPLTAASANDPSGRPAPNAAPPAHEHPQGTFDREAALASLPDGLRAVLSSQPTPVLQQALQDLGSGYIAKPDYTRTRQQETQELTELREKLTREAAAREQLQQLIEGSYAAEPPKPAPTAAELGQKLLEVTDPDEYMRVLGDAVGPMVEQRAQQLIAQHPILRRLEAAAAIEAVIPPGTNPEVARRGHEAFKQDLRAKGIDPDLVDHKVKAVLVPAWIEREQLRDQLRSGGNGAATTEPSRHAGAPAVTPVSATGPSAATTDPDVDYGKTFGSDSTLKDRVAATLRGLGMTPGDLTRLRQGQRSV